MGQQIFYMSFLLIKKQITALAEKNQLKAVNLFLFKKLRGLSSRRDFLRLQEIGRASCRERV